MRRNPNYLYHLTDRDLMDNIRIWGLIPKIGENSKVCQEEHAYIYLCDWDSIPYWQILLGKSCLVRIQDTFLTDIRQFRYDHYCEFLTEKSIPADLITEVQMPKFDRKGIMHKLNLSYLKSISYTCVSLARYYKYQDWHMKDYVHRNLKILCHTLKNLNYSLSDETELIKYLWAYGNDGEYAFTDTYMNTGMKLWQQLLQYPKDELYKDRKELYDYIRENFSDSLLSLNTGGWTG